MGKSAVKGLIVFLLCALLPLSSWAAGLGRLSVLSALGQPLRAEIEVVSQPGEDLDGLSAKLAPIEAYRIAKIEFADILLAVTASIQRRGNALVVQLSSVQPINDPFIDVLVELNWASGRLVREYTFLLDPPEYRGPAQAAMPAVVEPARAEPLVLPAPAAAPAAAPSIASAASPAASSAAASAAPKAPLALVPNPPSRAAASARVNGRPSDAPAQAAAAQGAVPAPVPASGAATAGTAPGERTYLVRPGDTLGRVAQQYAIEGVSLEQMLISLQRSNPQAFDGENINRLRSGQVLQLPDRAAAEAVVPTEARQQVAAQALAFREFRGGLAQAVAAAPARSESTRQASGRVTAPEADKPIAPAPKSDQLRLSSSNASDSKSGKSAKTEKAGQGEKGEKGASSGDTAASKDDEVARQKMAKELQERIALLERNLDDIAKLEALRRQAAGQPAAQPEAQSPAPSASQPTVQPAAPAGNPAAPGLPMPGAAPEETSFSVEAMLDVMTHVLDDAMSRALPLVERLLDDPMASLIEEPESVLLLLALPLLLLLWLWMRWRTRNVQNVSERQDPVPSDAAAGMDGLHGANDGFVNYTSTSSATAALQTLDSAVAVTASNGAAASPAAGGSSPEAFDFDLDFDAVPATDGAQLEELPSTEPLTQAAAATASPTPAAVLDFELDSDDSVPAAPSSPEGVGTFSHDAVQTTLGASSVYQDTVLDFDLGEDEPSQAVATAPAERPLINFDGISLDLEPAENTPAPQPLQADVPASQAATETVWQEVEIKLDLAKAYLEMTDRAGARELLQEVLSEGDAAQQQRAQALLDSLS